MATRYNLKLMSVIRAKSLKNIVVYEAVGIHQVRFSRIITGKYDPTQAEKRAIAQFLKVPQKEIF